MKTRKARKFIEKSRDCMKELQALSFTEMRMIHGGAVYLVYDLNTDTWYIVIR
jgi:hypothetical protein